MFREEKLDNSFCFGGEGVVNVFGRRRSVIFVVLALKFGWEVREVRIAVPSSPAPRMRMEDGNAMVRFCVIKRWIGKVVISIWCMCC